jgi:glycerol-3-phosphate dehydrogenase
MKRSFSDLAGESFDLIVLGGGIVGTGIARDAAYRGLKTLLVEKEDFAYGTTSRSSRLIHGGLRYLSHLQFGLVRQDMHEREILLKIAPHLVNPLAFIIPITRPLDWVIMGMGMLLYNILSFDKSLPSYRRLSRRETLELEPDIKLEGLAGAYLYYDCQVSFAERLCLENALSAAEHGAFVVNHAKATRILRAGDTVRGVQVEDAQSGENYQVAGNVLVNATGNWADQILGMLGNHPKPFIRTTKGIHLLTQQVSRNAIVLFTQTDGRLIFTLPWEGYSLIGTTDTDYSGNLDTVHAEAMDVDYLVTEVQRAFPSVRKENVLYTVAGLRSLVDTGGKRTSDISRSHKIVDHERMDGVSGFISVLGGKMTGYRAIAEEVVDIVCRKLGVKARCSTSEASLPGAPPVSREKLEQMAQETGLPQQVLEHLNALYGSRLYQVLDLVRSDTRGSQTICPHSPDILAQIWHAVKEESAITVGDFLFRRSAIGLASCQGLDAVETVAREMGHLLRWNTAEQRRQIEDYRSLAALGQRFKAGLPSSTRPALEH